jgi:dUTP diphosphatase
MTITSSSNIRYWLIEWYYNALGKKIQTFLAAKLTMGVDSDIILPLESNMITLKIKLIHEKAILPYYAHPGDSGLDLFSVERKEIPSSESALIATGLVIQLPEYTEAQIRPRSGLALKHQVTLLNTPGTIDCGYRGEIKVIMINHGKNTFIVEEGMKIAQMIVKPVIPVTVEQVAELSDTSRGEGGFGSTGMQ